MHPCTTACTERMHKREREREIENEREISEALCRLVGLNLGLDSDLEVYLS